MKKRLITAGILLVVLGGAFALRLINTYGVYVFDLLIGGLAIFCALEFANMLNHAGKPVSTTATGLYPSFMFAGHMFYFLFNLANYWYVVIQLSILLAMFVITFISYLFIKTKEVELYKEKHGVTQLQYAVKVSYSSLLTFIYPTLLLLGLMLLNRIDYFGIGNVSSFGGNLGWVVLITTFLIPIITDSFAMICGSFIKGPKLCAKISPNKTISGAVCATVFSSIIAGAFFFIFNAFGSISIGFAEFGIQSYHFVILGFIGSIVCQIGDIFESMWKRKAQMKDSGNIFPGHGGFLDRMDSHIFCAPFVFLFFILLLVI